MSEIDKGLMCKMYKDLLQINAKIQKIYQRHGQRMRIGNKKD